jgi:hypothetical protein
VNIAKRSDGWIARVAFRGQNTQGPREYGSKSRDRPPSAFLSNGHLSWRIAERGKKVAHLLLTLSTGCFVENNRRKNPNF